MIQITNSRKGWLMEIMKVKFENKTANNIYKIIARFSKRFIY